MKKVLIVDSDISTVKLLKNLISKKLHLSYESATSYRSLKKLLENSDDFFIALVNSSFDDCIDGVCIDYVISNGISVIAMSDKDDEKLHKLIKSKDILDFVDKRNNSSFNYSIRLIQFINNFKGSKVLIVDDMQTSRMQMLFSLEKLPLDVYQASSAKEALSVLEKNCDIQLIITDQNMPEMTGIEMVRIVREKFCLNELPIIGISASSESMISVEFLKNGANDFINKPFMPEELLSRVISNLEMQYYIKLAEESAVTDFLTGLYNRKYLYETGLKLYENAKRDHLSIVVAMIDIDYFKKINDRYGHEVGDISLKMLGKLLKDNFRGSDVVTRYGGEEFCVILTNTSTKLAFDIMEKVRLEVENLVVKFHNISFRMSISIGLNADISSSFDQMIALADEKLYKAKNEGRNRVII